jgi:hypothetical protein
MFIVLFCLPKKEPSLRRARQKMHSAAADGLGFGATVNPALLITLCAE